MEKISILQYHLSPKISVFCEAVANYITKLRGLKQTAQLLATSLSLVANYITKLRGLKLLNIPKPLHPNPVANYITKLRGLKLDDELSIWLIIELQIISQNYVV